MKDQDHLYTVLSPVFPPEKDIDVDSDTKPLTHSASIQVFIKLVEPVVFLRGFDSNSRSDTSTNNNNNKESNQDSILRGSLIIRILKPTKLKSISLNFRGYSRTEWPEGIPIKKNEYMEINNIVNHTWPFYNFDKDKFKNNHTNTANSNNNRLTYLLQNSGASTFRPLPNRTHHNINSSSNFFSNDSISNNNILSKHNTNTNTNTDTDTNTNTTNSTHTNNIQRNNNSNTDPKSTRHRTNSVSSNISNKSVKSNRSLSPFSLFRRNNNTIKVANNINSSNPNISTTSTSSITNPTINAIANPTFNPESIFSDLFGLNNNNDDTSIINKNISNHHHHHHSNDSFIFEPGDYIYTFEQLIPQNSPESIKADYGFVEYYLLATIERFGTFKSNLNARLPITLIRTQNDNSVEETEPIVISRKWENELKYDILIASKDIILDAFLPIQFTFLPLDKVILHRLRVYVTESMEYFCKNRKVHRMEPTKKFLLAELNGPLIDKNISNNNNNKSIKAKYLGNLLEENGYLVNKNFEFQVFIPNRFNNQQNLHPDTAYENIKSNHWIKICLRLSKMVDGRRKHYEISIDSPIHVLNKLCSHANTLVPSYDSHLFFNNTSNNSNSNNSNSNNSSINTPMLHDNINLYHNSNFFFPKEVIMSPLVSPNVKPLDINLNGPIKSPLPRPTKIPITIDNLNINDNDNNNTSTISTTNNNNSHNDKTTPIFTSPKLLTNLYQPESLQRELASPQAIPLSPISSPILRNNFMLNDMASLKSLDDDIPPINLPSFDEVLREEEDNNDGDIISISSNSSAVNGISTNNQSSILLPRNPPSYISVLNSDGIDHPTYPKLNNLDKFTNKTKSNSNNNIARVPKITINRSQDSLLSRKEFDTTIDNELENSFIASDQENDPNDIASAFSFQNSISQNLPAAVANSHSPRLKPVLNSNNVPTHFSRRNSIQDNLPSTTRTDNLFFNDLNQMLNDSEINDPDDDDDDDDIENANKIHNNIDDGHLKSNFNSISARSSFDKNTIVLDKELTSMPHLLENEETTIIDNNNNNGNNSMNDLFMQSKDSITDFLNPPNPLESSVDITALYDRTSIGWHALQLNTPDIVSSSNNSNIIKFDLAKSSTSPRSSSSTKKSHLEQDEDDSNMINSLIYEKVTRNIDNNLA